MSADADGPDPGGALTPGLRASVSAQVTATDTAVALGSGDVPVLGTPRLLALAEAAAVAAVAPRLAPGQTTVGTAVSLEHKRATAVGARVDVEAELTEVTGRRLVFGFIAYGPGDGDDAVIGAGTIERVIVDAARFAARAAGKERGPVPER